MRPLRVSLAHKCQLLFGAAVLLLLGAALWVVWGRMDELANQGPRERAAVLGDLLSRRLEKQESEQWSASLADLPAGVSARACPAGDPALSGGGFLADAWDRFVHFPSAEDRFSPGRGADGQFIIRHAQALRAPGVAGGAPALRGVLLVEVDGREAESAARANIVYLLAAGLFAALIAIVLFWYLTSRIFLQPVRLLTDTTDQATAGDLSVRADLPTGDEFEELASAFNRLVESVRLAQNRLQDANRQLDVKVGELAATNTSLDAANRIKSEFLANVSHELRTPLNSIIGFGELLEAGLPDDGGADAAKRRRYAGNIVRAGRGLLDLINDLLDIAKAEAGRLDVRLTTFSVFDQVENLAALLRPQAEKKHIRLQVDLEPNLPLIESDAGKIQQILFNLLSNAIKFSPEQSTVRLEVGLAFEPREEAPVHVLRFTVADQGPGIAAADQARIFDKFTQLDPQATRRTGGTGLGLHISRQLARLLGGDVTLVSEPGAGAHFTLSVPLGERGPAEAAG